jgi:hypothetical protein
MNKILLLSIIFLFLPLVLFTQQSSPNDRDSLPSPSFFDRLYALKADVLELTVETDMRQLIWEKDEEKYLPATIRYLNDEGDTIRWEAEVRARGNARKKICYYPPVKIKLKKSILRERDTDDDYKSFKIVNQCNNDGPSESYAIKEYLAYKLYNVATPYSFRVRMLSVTYIDSGSRKRKETRLYGFLIEDEEELAERWGGDLLEREKFGAHMLEQGPLQCLALFQYMIGNTDWAVANLHNLEIIKVPEFQKVIAVPYDFDYSGLVNTSYAVPHSSLPISDVQERLYRGPDCTEEEASRWIKHFRERKEAFLQACRQPPLLDEKDEKQVEQYLSSFFEELETPESIMKTLCRKSD